MEGWPITQSAAAPRSPSSRCARCGRTVMTPSQSRRTGRRVRPPGPEAGSWSTRRPGLSRAWFRRENSPAGSGRWTCSPMCPGFPAIWGRLPQLTVRRWWISSSIATLSPRATGRSAPPSAATRCRWNGTARGSPPGCAPRRSPGAVITAPTSWAWTVPGGLCRPWDQLRTRSTGAWPEPTACRPSPTRGWAGHQPGAAQPGR